jgi:hypothetical protein
VDVARERRRVVTRMGSMDLEVVESRRIKHFTIVD